MSKEDEVETIIGILFAHLRQFQTPTYVGSPRPYLPGLVSQFWDTIEKQIVATRRELSGIKEYELKAGASYLLGKNGQFHRQLNEGFFRVFEHVRKIEPPPWFACGFGMSAFRADFRHWAQMQTWRWDEATAVSIGFEPFGPIEKIKNLNLAHTDVTTFYFKRRQVIGNNFFQFGDHTQIKLSPRAFCDWCIEVGLEVPEDLLSAVSKVTGASYDIRRPWADATDEPDLESRERESLIKLVICLAIRGYGYQPTAIRSEIPNQIRSDMNTLGLDLHPDTIRRYLKEGAAILPDEAKEEQTMRPRRSGRPKAE